MTNSKKVRATIEAIVEEAKVFGSSYLGSDAVLGEQYMIKRAKKVLNWIKRNEVENVYTYYDHNAKEWYLVAVK